MMEELHQQLATTTTAALQKKEQCKRIIHGTKTNVDIIRATLMEFCALISVFFSFSLSVSLLSIVPLSKCVLTTKIGSSFFSVRFGTTLCFDIRMLLKCAKLHVRLGLHRSTFCVCENCTKQISQKNGSQNDREHERERESTHTHTRNNEEKDREAIYSMQKSRKIPSKTSKMA